MRRPGTPDIDRVTTVTSDATALRVYWTRPSGTLTKYQLQRRRSGQSWPHLSQVAEPGRNETRYTYTGLERGITYVFRLRACNGSTCSDWNDDDDDGRLELPGTEPDLQPPGPVTSVSFSNLTTTSFTVTWGAPASDGGTAISGYGIQRKLGDAAWPPTDQVVVVGREPRARTFEGLREGTHWVRIQACNGKNRCAPWPTAGHSVAIPPPTDQVRNLRAVGSVGRLTVTWTAPANTGDQTITRYLVQYRIQGQTAWDTVPGPVTGTSVTIGNLRNEATYDVQVQACYNATNADCGTAAHTTGTPTAGDPNVNPPPGPDTTPRPIAGCGSIAPGALAKPRDLDIVPYPQRRALLTWVGSEAATHYSVRISQGGSSTSVSFRVENDPCWQIALDSILHANPRQGLANATAFQFEVIARVIDSNGTILRSVGPSESVTLVDNPIVSINGNSKNTQDGQGRAEITWSAVTGATAYTIMYRELPGFHWSPGWAVELPTVSLPRRSIDVALADASVDPDDHTRLRYTIGGTRNTVNPLTRGEIYAVSINYRKGADKYFAAREAYVWPSDRPADGGERVGSFPLVQMIPDKTYRYYICQDTFHPAGILNVRRDAWVSLIMDAVELWESASQGLIISERVDEPCVNFDSVVTELEKDIRRKRNSPDISEEDLQGIVRSLITRLRQSAAGRISSVLLSNRNEILMYNDVDGALAYFRDVDVFSELAHDLGYRCWYRDGKYRDNVAMCVVPDDRGGSWRSDIVVRRSIYEDDPLLLPRSNNRFNTCPRTQPGHGNAPTTDPFYAAFTDMVHEVGHALGIRGGTQIMWANPGHPQVADSVMNYDNLAVPLDPRKPPVVRDDFHPYFQEPDCAPPRWM